MVAYWLNQGNKITEGKYAGRYGRVVDLEDGTNPITTYGATQDEVMGKIERTMMHTQRELGQVRRQAAQPPAAPPAAPKPASSASPRLTPEQTMQATADLRDPARAGSAVARLLESATGVDLQKIVLQNFAAICEQWETRHPEFFRHTANQRLLTDNALLRTRGQLKDITVEVLDAAYADLVAGGNLVTREELADPQEPETLAASPQQTAAPRADTRPPSRFATVHRSSRLGGTQTVTWSPKYSKEQIDRMPMAKQDRLLRDNDKDYVESVNYWYSSGRRATA